MGVCPHVCVYANREWLLIPLAVSVFFVRLLTKFFYFAYAANHPTAAGTAGTILKFTC